jgi:hypothetical protein
MHTHIRALSRLRRRCFNVLSLEDIIPLDMPDGVTQIVYSMALDNVMGWLAIGLTSSAGFEIIDRYGGCYFQPHFASSLRDVIVPVNSSMFIF